MSIEIKMPALSPTMEEGTLAKWLVKEGDSVKSGDIMAEIETDKATMEFEAVDEGVVAKILVAEGTDNVKVGTVIMQLEGEGAEAAPAAARTAPAQAPTARPAAPRFPTARRGYDPASVDRQVAALVTDRDRLAESLESAVARIAALEAELGAVLGR